MKLLANENVPLLAVEALRRGGHDVLWARSDLPGRPDGEVLRRAQGEARVVVTFDKDFGELAFRSGLPAACGILLFRFRVQSPERVARRVLETLAARSDWTGHLFVIEENTASASGPFPESGRRHPLIRIAEAGEGYEYLAEVPEAGRRWAGADRGRRGA